MAQINLNVKLVTTAAEKSLADLKNSLDLIAKSLNSMTPNKDLTAQLNALSRAYGSLTKASNEQLKADVERQKLEKSLAKLEADTAKSEAQRAKATSDVAIAAEKAAQQIEKTRASTEKANQEATKAKIQGEKLEQQTIKTAQAQEQYEKSTGEASEKTEVFGKKLGDVIERFIKFEAASLLIRTPLNKIKQALEEVGDTLVETENKVIEIRRILDDPEPADEIANRLYDLAFQYGQTFENVSEIASNFARTGRDFEESLKATEAALLAMNVAELNATQASEGLISILAQFKKEPEDLLKVVDQLNKAADKNPVTTGKLLTALQRTGSSAQNANMSLERTVGVITSLSEATNRTGQNLGTAVNSLIQYSTKAESLDLFASLSESAKEAVEQYRIGAADILEVWSAVADEINRLQSESKEKQDEFFAKFDTEEVEQLSSTLHDELGDIYDQIGDVYNVANTYRKNYFIALLANMERVFKVENEIADAEGYSQKENEQYMETYTAKVNQLQTAWQKLANDEQGILKFKKWLVEVGIALVDFTRESGGLISTLGEVAGLVGGLALITKAEKLTQTVSTLGATLKATITGTGTALQTSLGVIGLVSAAISGVVIAVNAYSTAQQEARDETIQNWKENKENAAKLQDLRKQLEDLTPKSEDYLSVEEQIVGILGDKKILLEDLTKGTQEYSDKVKELTDAELEHERSLRIQAKEAAEGNLKSALAKWIDKADALGGFNGLFNTAAGNIAGFAEELGYRSRVSDSSALYTTDFSKTYEILTKYKEKLDEITKQYDRLKVTGAEIPKDLEQQYNAMNKVWDSVKGAYNEYQAFVDEEEKAAEASIEHTKSVNEFIKSHDELAQIGIRNLQQMAKEEGKSLESLIGWTEDWKEKEEAATEAQNALNGAIKSTSQSFKDLSEEAAKHEKTLSTVLKAQEEYNKNGAVSTSTMDALLKLDDEYVAALFDEHHALDLNSESVRALNETRAKWLEDHGLIVPAIEDETEATRKAHQTTAELNQQTLNRNELKQKLKTTIEAVNDAEYELTKTGKLSEETESRLLALETKIVRAMKDENGEIDLSNDKLKKIIDRYKDLAKELGVAIKETEKFTEETSTAIETVTNLISLRKSELTLAEKSNASLWEREMKMREIIAEIGNEIAELQATQEIINGVGTKQEEINRLKAEQLDYEEKIRSMYEKAAEEQQKLVEQQQKAAEEAQKAAEKLAEEQRKAEEERLKAIEDAQKAQVAAYDAEIALFNSKITLNEAENGAISERIEYYNEILRVLAEKIEYLQYIGEAEATINGLKVQELQIQEKISALEQEAALGAIQEEIALQESRLKLAEKTEGAEEQRIDILVRINALLAAQINYLSAIGASEQTINAVKLEQLNIQSQILALEQQTLALQRDGELGAIQNTLDALLNGIEIEEESLDLTEKQIDLENERADTLQKSADLEEKIAAAKLDYINSVIDAYMKAESSESTLEEKQAAVQAARDKLAQARRDAVAKAMTAAYKAQQKQQKDALELEEKRLSVEQARRALVAAENDLSTRVYDEESGEWQRQADARKVDDAKEAFKDAVEALNDFVEEQAWDEVISAVQSGSISESQMSGILAKWAMENYGEGTPEFMAKIRVAYRDALGSVDQDDTVIGAQKAVENAVDALNNYLKSEAVKELKEYLAAGNRDAEGMRAILDKWLGLGEGTQLYSWRDGLLDVVTEAIESNAYDDTNLRSSVEGVSTAVRGTTNAVVGTTRAVNSLEKTFVTEINQAAKVSAAAIAEVISKYADSIEQKYIDWANDVKDTVAAYEEKEGYYNDIVRNGLTQAEIDSYIEEMKANSAAWAKADPEERQRLEDRNLYLGNKLGWTRDDASGIWYDELGFRAYDKGGVLDGMGGIKATSRPEIVLDPDLTSKILKPTSEAQFRAFTDAMRIMFGSGNRTPDAKAVYNGQRYSDSHDTSTVINGVPISQQMAETYTIAELCRIMPMIGRA